MKRILLLSLLIMCSRHLLAGGSGPEKIDSLTSFKGTYLGGGVGGFFPFYKTQVTTSVTAVLPYLAGVNGNSDISSNNVFGTIFLGYGFVFNSFYVGPEVYFNAGRQPNASLMIQAVNSNPSELLSTYSMAKLNSWEEGIDGRLGWVATPATLLFIRLGAAFNNLALNSNTTAYTQGSIVPQTKVLNYKASTFLVGFRAGAGLEQKLTPRISVRGDYVYTYYGSISTQGSNYNSPLGPIINTTQIHLQSQAVMGSIIYHFSI